MSKDLTNLEVLSTRTGFNSTVRQIQKTIGISKDVESDNLADILYELGDEEISGNRTGLLLRMILVDKLGYKAVSSNLITVVEDPTQLALEFAKWKGIDLIVAYHHPEIGLLLANPKVAEELAGFGKLRKRELLVVYAGKQGKPVDESCQRAAELALSLFSGAKAKVPAALLKGSFRVRKLSKPSEGDNKTAASAKASKAKTASRTALKEKPASSARRIAAPVVTASSMVLPAKGTLKMTPHYAVVVQNELFHNGNVEAWKRIVASYKAKHPELEVYIYYEGERILDINSLFKWGKVKHGSAIEFAVAGNGIQDVAKLQRYLSQGASPQFEAFLHGPVNTVLKLF
ncbi:MAG: hypothetical protein LBK62_05385 [Treponema sp.]|jgi:hypothetical protein|nr:hypothetical protein [Treponema sp.]